MSTSFLATALFATYAAAQLTTSVWLPGAANSNVSFVGSVIAQSGDRTTLSVSFSDPDATDDDYYSESPKTITVGGGTFVAYQVTAEDSFGDTGASITLSLGCTRKDTSAVPTCTMLTSGIADVISSICAKTASAVTPLEGASYCNNMGALTTEQTLTLSGESSAYFNNFPLTITGGTEKLGASAAATPTASGASATHSGSAASGASASHGPASTGSVKPSAASSSGVAQQPTGAAAPMMTLAPALAGLGAAAAFFL